MGRSAPFSEVTVDVRIPAEFERGRVLRTLTETALLVAGLALDEVIEFQIAIDETATALIEVAVGGSEIRCGLRFAGDRIRANMAAIALTRAPIDERGLGWSLVCTVAESPAVNVGQFDAEGGGYPVTVVFDRAGAQHGE